MGSLDQTCDTADASLAHAVASQVDRHFQKAAIVDGETTITYGALHRRAQALAAALVCRDDAGWAPEEVVGILTRHGAEQIVAQLAVVYAGGTCLPLDNTLSDDDIRVRLAAAQAKHLVVDATGWSRCRRQGGALPLDGGIVTTVVDLGDVPVSVRGDGGSGGRAGALPREVPSDHRSHVFFTSGTTGTPKAVQVPARGILDLARAPCWGGRVGEQRFGHLTSAGFDGSVIDIWVPLVHGATIVVLRRAQALSPALLERSLRAQRVTALWMTASLFGLVAAARPGAFAALDSLYTGGESPSLGACRAVLQQTAPPRRLVNGYGPTECSVLATWHEITPADVERGVLPIGRPMPHVVALVLDDRLRPVAGARQQAGELFLGGPALSRGYLHDPAKTEASFVSVDVDGRQLTLYRTGDAVYEDERGRLVWTARRDREVKIRGYRVRLDVVEAELLATGLVSAVAALKLQPPGSHTSLLVACVVYKTTTATTTSPMRPRKNDEELLARARARLPAYMVPRLVAWEALPVNRNGKIDRSRVLAEVEERFRHRQEELDAADVAVPSDGAVMTPTERKLKDLWCRVLVGIPPAHVGPEADFFAWGASSLDTASLIAGIRDRFDVQMPLRTVYEHPRLAAMAACIDQEQPQTFAEHAEAIKAVLRHDSTTLVKEVSVPAGAAVVDWRAPGQGHVFLTGATGFVAAHLLAQLLPLPETRTVLCLVRAGSAAAGRARVLANLARYGLDDAARSGAAKIEVVLGDLARPQLGLDEAQFRALAHRASVVYHVGAHVDYNQPYASHRAANVLGTLHVLQLAAAGQLKAVHYTSSVSAFGPTGLTAAGAQPPAVLREDAPLTAFLETTIPYEIGYGQSQWVVEEMVAELMRRGFPMAVYRLGFVLCSSRDGVGNPDDFVGRLLVDCLRLGAFPRLPGQRKELIPVDYVASAVLRISLSNANLGRAYHITPELGTAVDMNDLFTMVARCCGRELRGVTYQDWIRMLKEAAARGGDELRLAPLIPMLEEKVYGERTRWELYEGMAGFAVDNTVRALTASAGCQASGPPAVDEEILRRYLATLGLAGGEFDGAGRSKSSRYE